MAKAKRTSTSAADAFNTSRNEWLNRAGPNTNWEVIFDSTLPAGAAEILRHADEEKRHKEQMQELRAIHEALTSTATHSPSADQPPHGKHDGPQKKLIRKALQKVYPPDGKAPANLSYKAILKALYDVFRDWKLTMPHRKTIVAVVKEIGRSSALVF
jgi:hypothetical protein